MVFIFFCFALLRRIYKEIKYCFKLAVHTHTHLLSSQFRDRGRESIRQHHHSTTRRETTFKQCVNYIMNIVWHWSPVHGDIVHIAKEINRINKLNRFILWWLTHTQRHLRSFHRFFFSLANYLFIYFLTTTITNRDCVCVC